MVGVVIYVMEKADSISLTREVVNGLEEEQLPFAIEYLEFKSCNFIEMAYQAASQSLFGVGICITPKEIILHYAKLPKKTPLFVISESKINVNKARLLGLNAARLIKGIPFAEI